MPTISENISKSYKTANSLLKYLEEKNKVNIVEINYSILIKNYIIKNEDKFYRIKSISGDNVELYEIAKSDTIIYYDFIDESKTPIKFISLDVLKKQTVIGVNIYTLKSNDDSEIVNCNNTTKICQVKNLFHSTNYQQNKNSSYNPYNYYGNWYSLGIDIKCVPLPQESASYTNYEMPIQYIYVYTIKQPIKLLFSSKLV